MKTTSPRSEVANRLSMKVCAPAAAAPVRIDRVDGGIDRPGHPGPEHMAGGHSGQGNARRDGGQRKDVPDLFRGETPHGSRPHDPRSRGIAAFIGVGIACVERTRKVERFGRLDQCDRGLPGDRTGSVERRIHTTSVCPQERIGLHGSQERPLSAFRFHLPEQSGVSGTGRLDQISPVLRPRGGHGAGDYRDRQRQ